MSKYLQSLLDVLDKTKRQIEIHSSDYPFPSLLQIAKKLKEQDKAMSLVVDNDLFGYQIQLLIEASADHFDIKL